MIPIKRGTARRLGLKLPRSKMFMAFDGTRTDEPLLFVEGEVWTRPANSEGPWISGGEFEAAFAQPSMVDIVRDLNYRLAAATVAHVKPVRFLRRADFGTAQPS